MTLTWVTLLVTQIHPDWAETGAHEKEFFHNSAASLFVFQSVIGAFDPVCDGTVEIKDV